MLCKWKLLNIPVHITISFIIRAFTYTHKQGQRKLQQSVLHSQMKK